MLVLIRLLDDLVQGLRHGSKLTYSVHISRDGSEKVGSAVDKRCRLNPFTITLWFATSEGMRTIDNKYIPIWWHQLLHLYLLGWTCLIYIWIHGSKLTFPGHYIAINEGEKVLCAIEQRSRDFAFIPCYASWLVIHLCSVTSIIYWPVTSDYMN